MISLDTIFNLSLPSKNKQLGEVVSEEERQMAYRVVCHVVPCFHRSVGSTEEQAMMHAYNHQRDVHRNVVALLGKGKACSRCGRLSVTIRCT